jgi:hypothetical protein
LKQYREDIGYWTLTSQSLQLKENAEIKIIPGVAGGDGWEWEVTAASL